MKSILHILATAFLALSLFSASAAAFPIVVPISVGGGGPSEAQVQKRIREEMARKEASEHEVLLETGIKRGDTLDVLKFTGQLAYRENVFTSSIIRFDLKVDQIEIRDPRLGLLSCGMYSGFLYCKPTGEGATPFTSAWEPYFVPDRPKQTGWGSALQIEPIVLTTDPSQYNNYLILHVQDIVVLTQEGGKFRCPVAEGSPAIRCEELK